MGVAGKGQQRHAGGNGVAAGAAMTALTPNAPEHQALASLASRYVTVSALPWLPTRFAGIELKILMEDKETGLLTALTRFAPGAVLPDHEHVELEQTFVLEGSLEDDEGVATAGNYVWRPAGSRHHARAPKGCLALSFFLRPNRFLDTDAPQ
jgi:anti-sigma factor ChrR (cupin superfamily)